MSFEIEQTAKMQTSDKFESLSEWVEVLTMIAVKLRLGQPLDSQDQIIAADNLMDLIRIKTASSTGGKGNRKYDNDNDRLIAQRTQKREWARANKPKA